MKRKQQHHVINEHNVEQVVLDYIKHIIDTHKETDKLTIIEKINEITKTIKG